MYRRDYILRLIERFGRVLIALRNRILRREAGAEDVRAALQDVAEQAGLDLDLARRLDPGSLLLWLAPTDDVDEPKLWLMAELLYLEALHGREASPAAARGGLERALALFARLPPAWRPSDDFVTAGERSAEVRQLLAL